MAENVYKESLKLHSLKTDLNRLRAAHSVLARKLTHQLKSERKARTRTLIQLGGLVSMIGLTELCDIREGEDLQLDPLAHDKAATLVGILTTLVEQLPPTLAKEQIKSFQRKGIGALKKYAYQSLRS